MLISCARFVLTTALHTSPSETLHVQRCPDRHSPPPARGLVPKPPPPPSTMLGNALSSGPLKADRVVRIWTLFGCHAPASMEGQKT